MSADNWAICPQCGDQAKEAFEKKVALLDTSYGVLPLDEFDALRNEVAMGIDTEEYRTFREDYEFYIRDFTLHVSYSGWCEKCGTGLNIKEEHQIPQTERSK